jgi:hypothetical protein
MHRYINEYIIIKDRGERANRKRIFFLSRGDSIYFHFDRSALDVYSFEDTLMIRIINVSSKAQTSRKDQTTNVDQSK